MDNAITDLLDALIPNLESLFSDIRFWMGVIMVLGPVLLLLHGGYYLYLAPKEANHKAGYRTYFGMGSVQAWQYSQRLAGFVFGIAGGVLALVAIVGCIIMSGKETAEAVTPALVIVIIEAVVTLGAYGFVEVMIAKHYDAAGNLRVGSSERVRTGKADSKSLPE